MSEPVCTEITCNASVGGKVSIVKYDLSSDVHFSLSRKYSIPEDWTEEQVEEFQTQKELEVYKQVDAMAQVEVDELMEQSEVF
jgi:D-hexose-6-phosphate mutarotase